MYMNVKGVMDALFTGEHKYTVGLLFIFGNLAGYFLNMRKLKISDWVSVALLMAMMMLARLIV